MTAPLLLAAFVLIVLGALAFTNAVEWLASTSAPGPSARCSRPSALLCRSR